MTTSALPAFVSGRRVPNVWDAAAILCVLAGLVLVAHAAGGTLAPLPSATTIHLDLKYLPYYALRTTMRMFVALLFSIIFTLIVAPLAAKSRRLGVILIPALDILQSVPILGFLSFTVLFFLNLFPGRVIGAELAAVFAIFTSQAWNMTFSFYQSLTTVPRDLDEATRSFQLSTWQRFWRLEVPFAMPGLVFNTMLSMSGGWFFVVASEAVTVGNTTFLLPGIGSYVSVALSQSNLAAVIYAIIAMLVVILVYDQLLFRPLVAWSSKFRFEMTSGGEAPDPWVLSVLRRTRLLQMVGEAIGRVLSLKNTIVEIELASPTLRVTKGDGLSFFDRAGILQGAQVVEVLTQGDGQKNGHMPRVTVRLEQRDEKARASVLVGVAVGTLLHRNHDQAFQKTLKETIFDRRIAVDMTLTVDDAGFVLTLVDEDNVRATARIDVEKTLAEKAEMALAGIRTQLTKTGGTEFECASLEMDLDQAYFLPAAQWNALRRDALDNLRSRRLEARPILQTNVLRNDVAYPISTVDFEANIFNKRSREFYERHGATIAEPAAETGLDMRGRRLMTTAYCVKYELGACKRFPLDGQEALPSTVAAGERLREPLMMIDGDGRQFRLRFDCKNCRMEVWLPGKDEAKVGVK